MEVVLKNKKIAEQRDGRMICFNNYVLRNVKLLKQPLKSEGEKRFKSFILLLKKKINEIQTVSKRTGKSLAIGINVEFTTKLETIQRFILIIYPDSVSIKLTGRVSTNHLFVSIHSNEELFGEKLLEFLSILRDNQFQTLLSLIEDSHFCVYKVFN